jgi:hypothetical protein
MDAPAGVTDFLPAEESARQSQEVLNLSFLESAGKNQTFHKFQAFDRSTNLGIKIYLAPSWSEICSKSVLQIASETRKLWS